MVNKKILLFFKSQTESPTEIIMTTDGLKDFIESLRNNKFVKIGGESGIFFPVDSLSYIMFDDVRTGGQ